MGAQAIEGFSRDRLERIDRFLTEKYVTPGLMPHARFVLARDGRTVHETVLGQADPDHGRALTADAVFRI